MRQWPSFSNAEKAYQHCKGYWEGLLPRLRKHTRETESYRGIHVDMPARSHQFGKFIETKCAGPHLRGAQTKVEMSTEGRT